MTRKRLSSNVLPQALGELELAILKVLWDCPESSAKTIVGKLVSSRAVTLSTVQSSLETLRKKDLVDYVKRRQAFVYRAKLSRPELLGRFVKDVIHTLHDGKLDTILSSFVYVASNINDGALDDLEKLIREKKKSLEDKKAGKNND